MCVRVSVGDIKLKTWFDENCLIALIDPFSTFHFPPLLNNVGSTHTYTHSFSSSHLQRSVAAGDLYSSDLIRNHRASTSMIETVMSVFFLSLALSVLITGEEVPLLNDHFTRNCL